MKYKIISIRRGNIDKKVYFIEKDLPHDREDSGEYILSGTAYVYANSDSKLWKSKLIEQQKDFAIKQISECQKLIAELAGYQ